MNQLFNDRLFLDYILRSGVGNKTFILVPNDWFFVTIIQLSNVTSCFKLQKARRTTATFINLHYIASGQDCVSQP